MYIDRYIDTITRKTMLVLQWFMGNPIFYTFWSSLIHDNSFIFTEQQDIHSTAVKNLS